MSKPQYPPATSVAVAPLSQGSPPPARFKKIRVDGLETNKKSWGIANKQAKNWGKSPAKMILIEQQTFEK